MSREELREQIAAEAARLLLRGKEQDFAAARKRAARWLKRRRLHRDEIPSNQEIQVQLYALSGLMASERDPMLRAQMQHWVGQLMLALGPAPCLWLAPPEETPLAAGHELRVCVAGEQTLIRQQLLACGYATRVVPVTAEVGAGCWQLRIEGQFPCEIYGYASEAQFPAHTDARSCADLQTAAIEQPVAPYEPVDDEHPDAYGVFQMLLEPLARVQLPAHSHSEGDALYHSLQVFELGREQRPYDEEFLLACLLHDVGLAINPRHPVLSALDALGTLITDRTRYLIEQRPVAAIYLQTGECPRNLRRSPDFEEVVLLARCDRDGRVAGAQVGTLDEAFAYLESLASEWDEPDE